MLNFDAYFEPADELARLLYDFSQSTGTQRFQIGRKIYHSDYICRLRTIQSLSGVEFLSGKISAQRINSIKKDFFFNPAIPSFSKTNTALFPDMPYHRHDYLELVIVLKGQYTQSINGRLHRHREGDICMLNPNVLHRDVAPGPRDRVLFLGFSPNYLRGELTRGLKSHQKLSAFIEEQGGRSERQYILFHPQDFEQTETLLLHILEEDTHKLPGHHIIICGFLIRLFSQLSEGEHYEICCQNTSEIKDNLISEVLDYMRAHLSDVNRKELAAFFHFNPDYLNRLLIQVTGQNYSAHLRELRLEQAADQLRFTAMSVNTIIQNLGFSNKGHFNRIFREKFGVLPGEYRRQ